NCWMKSASARGRNSTLTDADLAMVVDDHLTGFGSQTVPESVISFHCLARIKTLKEQCFEFFARPFKTGSSRRLHGADRGIEGLLSRSIRASADDGLNSLLLLRRELHAYIVAPILPLHQHG